MALTFPLNGEGGGVSDDVEEISITSLGSETTSRDRCNGGRSVDLVDALENKLESRELGMSFARDGRPTGLAFEVEDAALTRGRDNEPGCFSDDDRSGV